MKRSHSMLTGLAVLLCLAFVITSCAPAATPAPPAAPTKAAAPTTAPVAAPTTEPAEPAGPSGTITYFNFSGADHPEELDEMVQAFEDANPGVTVKVETAPFADYFTKLSALIAGGQAPDVFELNYESFVSYASKGTAMDLAPLISADESFDPTIFYPRAYEAFQVDGTQYGLSESFSDVVLIYNKDLFEEAGVDQPTDDWTWDDALAAAKQLTDPAKGQWGLFKPTQFWEFYKTAYQFGADFFNAGKTEATFNDAKGVEALTFMNDLVNKEHVMPTDAEMGGVPDDQLFKQGKLAMWVNGIWQFNGLMDVPFEWDITVEPGAARKGTHFFSNAVVISKDCKNPDAAWAWLKFFTTSPDVAKIRIASSWELPALSDPALFEDYLSVPVPANRQAVFDALQYIVIPPVIEKQTEMQDAIGAQIDKVKLGQLTPQEALDAAKADVDALLK